MVEFKLVPHSARSVHIVEVWVDGTFQATIYPQEPNSIRVVSGYIDGNPEKESDWPQAWRFKFLGP